ncbi:hypothetical protein NCCP2145_33950 [Pseudarthrobacter sp. NCCP-2145]|nr:hypothetical protein NCCP2145_33950 [Pseudarthrobacter sp. NCCP-2145]
MADAPHPSAYQVAEAQPCPAHHAQQPRLVVLDGGKLAGACSARGAAGTSGFGGR